MEHIFEYQSSGSISDCNNASSSTRLSKRVPLKERIMKMKAVKIGIVATIIAVVVTSYVTSLVIGNITDFHGDVTVYSVLYRTVSICGGIAQVITAITLPVIGTQIVNAIKKGK